MLGNILTAKYAKELYDKSQEKRNAPIEKQQEINKLPTKQWAEIELNYIFQVIGIRAFEGKLCTEFPYKYISREKLEFLSMKLIDLGYNVELIDSKDFVMYNQIIRVGW